MDLNDFDDNDLSENPPQAGGPGNPQQGSSSSKPFVIGIAVLGGIVVIAMLLMIAYVLLSRPKTATDLENQAEQIRQQNTAIAMFASQTAEYNAAMATELAAPTETAVPPTSTAVLAVATATATQEAGATSVAVSGDPAARTATVAAFQTQAAAVTAGTSLPGVTSVIQVTSTALPSTGFAEDIGLPVLFGAAIVLVLIIVLARKLRFSDTQ
ncbi:MAG: hypothetical protein BGO78_00260 [Chloroflexi bacterium 44-23]|nr:MAG: hypothetical protein BGO78_00260 [Chloroflexi bacterium 44-23]